MKEAITRRRKKKPTRAAVERWGDVQGRMR